MYRDPTGTIWFGTSAGLSCLQGDAITSFNAIKQLSHRFISAIASDKEGLVIAHIGFQLLRFTNGALSPYTLDGAKTPFTSASGIYIFTMYSAEDGALWLGTTDGLYRLKPGEPIATAKRRGIDFPVTSIYDDHKGSLWLTGDVSGLFRLRLEDGRVTHYQKRNGLLDGEITQVLTDLHGNLWLSTSRGIWTIDRWELDDVADGRRATLHCASFDTFDGMKTNECSNNRHMPGGCRTEDGRLWFTTRKGVVVIDPDHIVRNALVPPVVIESLIADQHQVATGSTAVLRPGTAKLEIHYTCLSLLVPDRVSFRYRLEGYDQEWVDAGPRRVAYYTNLPPGNYRFRVIACNNDGVWNGTGAAMAFYLSPRFVQTKWFIALCTAATVLLFTAAYQLRLRQLSQRQKVLTALVGERTQSLREEIRVREKVEQELRKEIEVRQRAEAEAARVHKQLLVASHQAGMAEIATGVLHNVGNALNSVNVSTSIVADRVRKLRVPVLGKLAAVFQTHANDLGQYLTADEKGRQMPNYLAQLANYFASEQKEVLTEIDQLATGIDHMKALVARQQDYARVTGLSEVVEIDAVIDDALTINAESLKRHEIAVTKVLAKLPPIAVAKHKVLQILVNLIANAKDACADRPWENRRIEVKTEPVDDRIRISVIDSGVGIAPENLRRIFGQGFTTKKHGHGFGLHSSVLAAREMGGSLAVFSPGANQGATFVLELPVQPPKPNPAI